MAIAEQFAGLDMGQLIGGPLSAAADASVLLANSTADFINKVGFDNGKLRTVAFGYQKRSVNDDGTSNLDELKIDMPMLAIVPIPNLQLDEVNVLFDMEVKQSERSQQSLDVGASLNGSLNLGIFKVNISGSVSVHQENTRSSDNSAKYHVDVRATNHGTPEGLARVLDMMAANVAPSLVSSTLKDGNGQDLAGKAKTRAEQMKKLRSEISQIESRLTAANDSFRSTVAQFKNIAGAQQSIYQGIMNEKLGDLTDSDEDTKAAEQYETVFSQMDQTWTRLQNQAESLLRMVADNTDNADSLTGISGVLALKNFKIDNKTAASGDYTDSEKQYEALVAAQKNAVKAQKNVQSIEKTLTEKKQQYNDTIANS